MMRRFVKSVNLLGIIILQVLLLVGCQMSKKYNSVLPDETVSKSEQLTEMVSDVDVEVDKQSVIILYTNDVHTYINNEKTDEDENVTKLLSYASVAALKNELESNGENVILVDAGDHSQGTAYGGMDEGASIIKIMNETGYQLATLGNHEFDYGIFRTFQMMEEAEFSYISCNFYDVENEKNVLDATKIFEIGGNRIAFIGISTPETMTKTTPTYFMDETGNYIYDFKSAEEGKALYYSVQSAIDAVREQADYVIALGHMGVDASATPYRSIDIIEHVSGLDAFIDGHSHTRMEKQQIKDADGKDVLLTQTGSYLGAIGKMTISSEGAFQAELITDYSGRDTVVERMEQEWIDKVNNMLEEKIAILERTLYSKSPDNPQKRLVRRMETNLGDFNSDAYYYYFNEIQGIDCDIALVNGGGIRSDVEKGDISYFTTKTVNPFGNVACVVEVTGQDILDALEMGARAVGVIDDETGEYAEVGGFMQVAGLKYEIDTTLESEVVVDSNGIWQAAPGMYRVKNVEVYNKEKGTYETLNLEDKYRVAGINYILRNQGDGMSMFTDSGCIVDYMDVDYMVLAKYCMAFSRGKSDISVINTQNSPLSAYSGYLIDYENPYGAGRIKIIE